ncbi:NAD(P)-binding protein [Astrocystis sublimbata]|nr:NAD(P)-binding protein [Astrocystis sublimbata]
MASKLFAVVAGAGTGTGRAVALRFAKTYPVVLMARKPESYETTVSEINQAGGRALGITADVTDTKSMKIAFNSIKKELPGSKLAAAVYNVSSGYMIKPFLELKVEDLDDSFSGSARGLFNFAQETVPLLLEAVPESGNSPTLLITGATASIRGSARFGSLAAGMFARRALAQSLAREFQPQGVHVTHVLIDGLIDIPRTQAFAANDGVKDGKLNPAAPRSAFIQELDLRPFVENF